MNYNEMSIVSKKSSQNDAGNGFKIIEVNMTDSTENLYAVCTPIKKQ